MARSTVKLDSRGIGQTLKSGEMSALMRGTADDVAGNVDRQGVTTDEGERIPVEVETYTTDRAAASVTLAHAAGLAMQAQHGVLTRAAAAAGLEVTEK